MTFTFQLIENGSVPAAELPEGLASRMLSVSVTKITYLDIVPEGHLKDALAWYREHLGPEHLDRVYVSRYPDPRVVMTIREMCAALGV